MTLNPEAEVKEQWEKAISAEDARTLCILSQEVDDKGKSQYEHLIEWTPRYPVHSREDLDVWAAEEYVGWNTQPNNQQHQNIQATISKATEARTNKNPLLTYEQLCNELEETLNTVNTVEAVRKAVSRSITTNHGKKERPWEMGGCASEYTIIDATINGDKKKPGPKTCTYQKVDQGKV